DELLYRIALHVYLLRREASRQIERHHKRKRRLLQSAHRLEELNRADGAVLDQFEIFRFQVEHIVALWICNCNIDCYKISINTHENLLILSLPCLLRKTSLA